MADWELFEGDALEHLRALPDDSVDSVVSDPPYAEIGRAYGRWSESEWAEMIDPIVREIRRVLKPSGSAVFVFQVNQSRMGSARTWVWDFLARWAREWNVVQDAYWINASPMPTAGVQRDIGLLRAAVKPLAWLGPTDCYRNQAAVLDEPSERMKSVDPTDDTLRRSPSGGTMRSGRVARTVAERGGVSPVNYRVVANTVSIDHHGHGAATPYPLVAWWIRYLTPPGGLVLDPFVGSGTTVIAALREGMRGIGIERDPGYYQMARKRIDDDAPLFNRKGSTK